MNSAQLETHLSPLRTLREKTDQSGKFRLNFANEGCRKRPNGKLFWLAGVLTAQRSGIIQSPLSDSTLQLARCNTVPLCHMHRAAEVH